MVQSNQILFSGAIPIYTIGDFPSANISIQDSGIVQGTNQNYFEFGNVSIFDLNDNPIVKPGDIFRWTSPSFGQVVVVGYDANNTWIELETGIPSNVQGGTVYQRNENPGNAVFVNGFMFGTGIITLHLINGSTLEFNIDGVSNYLLPVIAKGVQNFTPATMNGVYALY